mgnify:CR=1 FL=1
MSKQSNQHPRNNPNQKDNSNMAQSAMKKNVDPNNFVVLGEKGVDQTVFSHVFKNKLQNLKNASNNNSNKKGNPNMKYNNNPHNIKISNTIYAPNKVSKIANGNNIIYTEIENQNHVSHNKKITNQLYNSIKANAPNPFFSPKNNNNNNNNLNLNNNNLINSNNINKNIQNKNMIFNKNNIQNEIVFNPKRTAIKNINKNNNNNNDNNNIINNNNNFLNNIQFQHNSKQNINNNIINNNQFKLNSNQNMNKNNHINKNQFQHNFNQNINDDNIININQQNQPQEKQNQGTYSFSRYKKAALTGLKNLGNTSYLNSVLQLVCYMRQFASYFLNPKNASYFEKNVEKCPLAYVVHRLCTHLYPYPEKDIREIYKPDSLMSILASYNAIYRNYSERNPKDFIIFLFDKLHEELNSKKNKNKIDFNFDNIKKDRNAIINYGISDFIKNNDSIISNYFNYFEIKEIRCTKCGDEYYAFQSFPAFELNINITSSWKKSQYVKISDCLEFYGMNQIKTIFCNICKRYNEIATLNQIYTSPNFFIFLLDIKENKNVNLILEQKLNLEKFIELKDKSPTIYELNGLVFFDRNKNKYNSLCAHPVDKNWYLIDDENVQLYDINSFMNLYNTQSNIYVPCILLYYGAIKK